MTNGHDVIPREFAAILDQECAGMTDLERVQARRIAALSLRFARKQYEHTGLALRNSEPSLLSGSATVRK